MIAIGGLIILSEPLADLIRGHPHDRIRVGVVDCFASEYFNPECSLFDSVLVATFQRMLDQPAKQHYTPAALLKRRVSEDAVSLSKDSRALLGTPRAFMRLFSEAGFRLSHGYSVSGL